MKNGDKPSSFEAILCHLLQVQTDVRFANSGSANYASEPTPLHPSEYALT